MQILRSLFLRMKCHNQWFQPHHLEHFRLCLFKKKKIQAQLHTFWISKNCMLINPVFLQAKRGIFPKRFQTFLPDFWTFPAEGSYLNVVKQQSVINLFCCKGVGVPRLLPFSYFNDIPQPPTPRPSKGKY